MSAELEERLEDLASTDQITAKDADEIRAFARFLEAINSWDRLGDNEDPGDRSWIRVFDSEPRLVVPDEWIPYVNGTGRAP